jgi:ABC-type uncharacterized transport system ATPase subunit
MLKITYVDKHFEKVTALQNINLTIEKGELFGFQLRQYLIGCKQYPKLL